MMMCRVKMMLPSTIMIFFCFFFAMSSRNLNQNNRILHQRSLFTMKFKWRLYSYVILKAQQFCFILCVFQQIYGSYLNISPQSVSWLHWGYCTLLIRLCNFTTEASLVSQHTSTGDDVKHYEDLSRLSFLFIPPYY